MASQSRSEQRNQWAQRVFAVVFAFCIVGLVLSTTAFKSDHSQSGRHHMGLNQKKAEAIERFTRPMGPWGERMLSPIDRALKEPRETWSRKEGRYPSSVDDQLLQ